MERPLSISPEVSRALTEGAAVVALESTVISHGLPWPENLELALELESRVRAQGATPATIALAGGQIRVGLDRVLLERLAREEGVQKVSRRDVAAVLARRELGATTVAGTLIGAGLSGIRVFATGGIGGVHRGGQDSLDVSADLAELARSDVAVVCAGAKAILDLGRTLEVLETLGVPVLGFRCAELPAFYHARSGLALQDTADTPEGVAERMRLKWALGLSGGLLVVQPPPADAALAPDEIEELIDRALAEAEAQGIRGKALTPFLLSRLGALSDRRSLKTNLALLRNNADLAARVAVAYARTIKPADSKI